MPKIEKYLAISYDTYKLVFGNWNLFLLAQFTAKTTNSERANYLFNK